jgi:hypothetical protein
MILNTKRPDPRSETKLIWYEKPQVKTISYDDTYTLFNIIYIVRILMRTLELTFNTKSL